MNIIKTVNNDGSVRWHNEFGQTHREDGPAFIGASEYTAWHINGQRHRENGPAVEWGDGTKEYWLLGEWIPEEKYLSTPIDKLILEIQLTKIIET